jgi:hypothetical protein
MKSTVTLFIFAAIAILAAAALCLALWQHHEVASLRAAGARVSATPSLAPTP